MAEPSLRYAYTFWLPSLIGIAGLHRFYLGRPLSGLLYLMTGGLLGFGTLYDLLAMPQLVRRVRLERRLDQILEGERRLSVPQPTMRPRRSGPRRSRPRDVERAILEYAAGHHGIVTPSPVALDASVSAEKAREHLDRLVAQGFAEAHVTGNGLIVYVFAEFLDERGHQELERLDG